jgi:hypothetical protein
MNLITLDSGLNWTQLAPLTREQMESLRTATPEQRREVNLQRIRPAKPEDAKVGQALYDQHKIEGSTLLGCDVVLPLGTGIINCRVGSEHKQIRF